MIDFVFLESLLVLILTCNLFCSTYDGVGMALNLEIDSAYKLQHD